MSERYLPHPDDLIDHEAAYLDYALRRGRVRELNTRLTDEHEGYNPLLDPEPWGEPPNPLLDEN